jgi:uncharacterized membrane protein YcaP (DUF421 family)
MSYFFNVLQEAIGFNSFTSMALLHTAIRGVIIYLFGITLARFNKTLFAIRAPFNFMLYIMLGSIFATATLNVNYFLPMLCTVSLLMLLNGLITMIVFYFPVVEPVIKGAPVIIVKNGKIQWDAMNKEFITESELLAELNSQLHIRDLSKIDTAILTSEGTICFITKNS